jgi:CheY-like chemotaxis protein
MLVDMLLPLGFHILEAENGQECLEKTLQHRPDVLLLDIRMPVMDGFETTQRIREFENQNSKVESRTSKVENDDSEFPVSSFQFPVPIIAVSASVFETARKRALAIGFNDFLFKPFQVENLLELLHTYLHMEWIYEEEVEEQPEVKSSILSASQPIVPLPSEEVNVLLKLAEYGNVKRILEQLNHIEGLGKRFLPLVTELRTLAKSFQVDEIVERLKEMQE